MKSIKTTCTVSLLTVAFVLAVNGYSQSFLTNGLVAYYPFNGNANDASGNGHNGTVNGAVLTADRFGNTNQAYLFSGTAYITAPLNSGIFSTDFTASVWFDTYDINNSWPTLLEEVGNTAFILGIAGQTSGVYPQNIGDLFAYAAHGGPNKDWQLGFGPLFQPSLNKYYQAVVVRAGTNVMMFLNGGLLATNQIVNPTVELGNIFYIGNAGDNGGPSSEYTFHGIIDDIRIYNRALSASEVQQLYQYESGPRVALLKAVKPSFSNLYLGTNYQLQVSADLNTWTNQGSPFTATNINMVWGQYFDVDNWNSLFFRLQVSP